MTTTVDLQIAASILAKASRAVASCGAGISAESGIATFRDAGGLWDRIDPIEVGTPAGLVNTLERKAAVLLPLFLELLDSFEQASPNPGHTALADLEAMGILTTIITQNVDNLHQEAGNSDVIEVHGNLFRMKCLACETVSTYDRKQLIGETRTGLTALTAFTLDALTTLAPKCPACGFRSSVW